MNKKLLTGVLHVIPTMVVTLLVCVFIISTAFAGDTVTIVDPSGDIQICKVTESGAIVCL